MTTNCRTAGTGDNAIADHADAIRMAIRPAAATDWPAIAALLTSAQLPLEGAHEHLAHFIVGEHDGRLVGAAGIEPYGNAALLRSVVVDGAVRGRGAGNQLQHAIAQHAAAQGIHRLILLTTTAAAFFARRGFRVIGRGDAPDAMLASREFQGVCPASATVMQKELLPAAVPEQGTMPCAPS